MFNKIKDWGSSQAAAAYLRSKIESYAELQTLEIDSSAKKLRVVLKLKGETEAIDFRVEGYELAGESENHLIVFTQVHCSREWVHRLAADHLVGKEIKVPSVVAKLL